VHSGNDQALAAPEHFNFATDVFDGCARQRPDAIALWCVHTAAETEEKLTFQELARLSCQTASFLNRKGVKRGDRVLLMLPRTPTWWMAMLGLIRLGALPVPATLLLTERDVSYRLNAARIHAVITSPEGLPKVGGFEGLRFLTGGSAPAWIDFDAGVSNASSNLDPAKTLSSDPGLLYFTSATTGEPKMVLHTQASYGLAHRVTGQHWLDLRPDDVHWNISDLGWGKAAWSSFFGPWHMGACVFALDAVGKFDPVRTLETLAHYPITTWCAPPTALRLIVRQDLSKYKFPHLRHCVTAGEPLNAEVLQLWRAATGLTLYEGYGQTETVVLVANSLSAGDPVRPGSMGKVAPGYDVALLDENLQPVPDGVEGEIAIRVKPKRPLGLFAEYWLNSEEMVEKFRGDFYLTGDRATRDRDGYFWFIGRKDDVIKSSGYRIGPFEVESALIEHPVVLDAAVVGAPDTLRGQIVKAFVVLRPDRAPCDELKIELQAHCKKLVAAYKYPREIEFVAELPKTVSGKTRHAELRKSCVQRVGDRPEARNSEFGSCAVLGTINSAFALRP
jgi:acetyl-CoA synthetase/medium-chain acyl-CoA synthetase